MALLPIRANEGVMRLGVSILASALAIALTNVASAADVKIGEPCR